MLLSASWNHSPVHYIYFKMLRASFFLVQLQAKKVSSKVFRCLDWMMQDGSNQKGQCCEEMGIMEEKRPVLYVSASGFVFLPSGPTVS